MRTFSDHPLSNYIHSLSKANKPFCRGYSAHEHTVLYSSLTSTALPQDIIIETLVSVLIVSIGLVLGAQKLKPISWREWAGEIERNGGARNPYLSLEERYGFWDIRVSFWIYLDTCLGTTGFGFIQDMNLLLDSIVSGLEYSKLTFG